jgi:hypothetical protein
MAPQIPWNAVVDQLLRTSKSTPPILQKTAIHAFGGLRARGRTKVFPLHKSFLHGRTVQLPSDREAPRKSRLNLSKMMFRAAKHEFEGALPRLRQ